MFFWKAHLDASKEPPLFVVAGYLGKRPQWKEFNKRWKLPLTRDGHTDIFHATEFEAGWGDFTEAKGWHKDRIESVRVELVEAIRDSHLLGITCTVVQKDYEISMQGWRRQHFGSMYEFCVRQCLASVVYFLQYAGEKESVAYILEHGDGEQGRLQEVFRQALAKPENREYYRLGSLAFDTKEGAIGLQAADMLAYHTWHREHGRQYGEPISRLFEDTDMIRNYFDRAAFQRLHARDDQGYSMAYPDGTLAFKTPPSINVRIHADFSESEEILQRLEWLMETSPDLAYALVKDSASVAKLFGLDTENDITAGAHDIRITLKPTEFALNNMAALRTPERDRELSE